MILLSSLALAAESDLILDLNIIGPLGDAIVDEDVALPYSATIDKAYGKGTYRIEVEAKPEGREVLLDVTVIDTKPRTETSVVALSLELPVETIQDGEKTIMAPRGLKLDGEKVQFATFHVEASWRWNSGDWPTEARSAELTPGDVAMVWEDAPLYVSPDEEAGFARLRPTEHVAGHGGYLPLEILEDQGDWIKVQPAAGDSCHSAPDSRLSSVSLDLYVQRGDLLYVTPATVSVDYDDGSHFELQPGVVVSPPEGRLLVGQGELLMTADAGDIVADVTLPEGSLGLAFPATVTRKLPAEQLQQVVTSSNRSLGETLGGEVYWLGVGPAYLQGSWELPADPDLDEADSEVVEENYVGDSSDRPDVGQAQGIVHGQCSVHHFQMLPSRIKPSDYVPNEGVGEEGVSTNSGSEGPQWTIAADTALNWSDGSQAGTTTEPVTLHGELSFEDRKTRCGHLLLDSSPVPATDGVSYEVDPSGAFEVCAERRAVTRK